jgi:hypothetical protein
MKKCTTLTEMKTAKIRLAGAIEREYSMTRTAGEELTEQVTSEAAVDGTVDGTGQVNDASAHPTRRYADRSASSDERHAEPERNGLLSLSAMDS